MSDYDKWIVTLEDCDDGSGDVMLPLPDELLDELGWEVDDEVKLVTIEEGFLLLIRAH